jgi:antitoxin YqcF
MSEISIENKALAKLVATAFGKQPSVRRFWDDNHEKHVDIATSRDCPQNGVSSYATLGLSDWPLILDGQEYQVRTELVGACASVFSNFDNALATAAFCIANSKWFCAPGVVFPDVLSLNNCSPTMKHFIFVPPFLWEDKMKTIDLKTKVVAWLLAVPISDEERKYASSKGSEALEDLFEKHQIDLFDLNRPSVI